MTTRDALIEFGLLNKKSLDVDFINPFLGSVVRTLSVQTSTEATPGKLAIKKPGEPLLGDISGVIGIVSPSLNGAVVISFPAATFLGLMSKMLGEECKEITRDLESGAGELINIIFGQAKVVLNHRGYALKTALPTIIVGRNHSVLNSSAGLVVIIPFETAVDGCM